MGKFEQAFASVEDAATAVIQPANGIVKLARQLQKAAKDGNIAALKRTQGRFDAAMQSLGGAVGHAAQSWPLTDEQEHQHLRDADGYAAELQEAAREQGLNIHERDSRLIASPSIVRILPAERAVRIDRKQVSTIRPSKLVALLKQNQGALGTYRSEAFLESLYKVYQELTLEEDTASHLIKHMGRMIQLARVYSLFTSLPRSEREYSRTDFARDLYLLEMNDVTTTRSGATIALSASTGARGSRAQNLFTFIDRDGREAKYYSVQFRRPNNGEYHSH